MKQVCILLFSFIFFSRADGQSLFGANSTYQHKVFSPASTLQIQQAVAAATVIQETKTTCDCHPPKPGINNFNPYTGNVHREIKDIEVWGGVGEIPLVLTRYGNSVGGMMWDV